MCANNTLRKFVLALSNHLHAGSLHDSRPFNEEKWFALIVEEDETKAWCPVDTKWMASAVFARRLAQWPSQMRRANHI